MTPLRLSTLATLFVLIAAACGGATESQSAGRAQSIPRPAPGVTESDVAVAELQPEPTTSPGSHGGSQNHSDKGAGVSVRVPPGWGVARERLTPYLSDPLEMLALGTYTLRPGGDRCAHNPVNALEGIGAEDAFVALFERAAPTASTGYPPRPARFALPTAEGTQRFCVPDPERLDEWMSFSDSGRAFYLLVALGTSASDETREELQAVLDSLAIAPR